MEGIEPVPALTAHVVVGHNPLEALNVRLSDSILECQLVFRRVHMEFCRIVPDLVTIFSKLDMIVILLHNGIILCMANSLELIFHCILHFLHFLSII